MTKLLKHERELPGWFHINKYKVFEDLSEQEFREQLFKRREMLSDDPQFLDLGLQISEGQMSELANGPILDTSNLDKGTLSGFILDGKRELPQYRKELFVEVRAADFYILGGTLEIDDPSVGPATTMTSLLRESGLDFPAFTRRPLVSKNRLPQTALATRHVCGCAA